MNQKKKASKSKKSLKENRLNKIKIILAICGSVVTLFFIPANFFQQKNNSIVTNCCYNHVFLLEKASMTPAIPFGKSPIMVEISVMQTSVR